jgi:SPP1 family predicted phage head-tail adaptor
VRETPVPPLGTLTDRVQLLHRNTTHEDEGGEVAVFTPLATVWARVRALTARQAFVSDARGFNLTHAIVIRFRTDFGPADRVVHRGRTYEVAAVNDINGRRAYLGCQCIERAVTA